MAGSADNGVLLQEAQAEVTALRSELYATRRTTWEAQQALNQVTAQRDGLQGRVQELERYMDQLQGQAVRVGTLELSQQQLQRSKAALESQLQQLQGRLTQSDASLAEEQTARHAAEEARNRVESDRARLQAARDELATRVLVAEQRAQEAEDEQIRAEQDAAAAQQELHALQARLADGDAAEVSVSGTSDSVRQLEAERARSASLLAALNAAKATSASAAADLGFAKERISQLERELQAQQAQQRAAGHSVQSSQGQGHGSSSDGRPGGNDNDPMAELQAARRRISHLEQQLQAAQGSARLAAHLPGHAARSASELAAAQERIRHLEHQLQVAGAHAAAPKPPLSSNVGGNLSAVARIQSAAGDLNSMAGSVASQDGTHAPLSAAETAAIVQKLRSQVGSLKQSRDKLLAQVDAQQGDVERLAVENQALTEALAGVRSTGAAFEAQAEAAMQRCERLTDLLEESASWNPNPHADHPGYHSMRHGEGTDTAATGQQAAAHVAGANGQLTDTVTDAHHSARRDENGDSVGNGDHSHANGVMAAGPGTESAEGPHCLAGLQQALLQERARCAALDLQVHALCAELTRATEISGDLERSALPFLNGIEGRLTQLLRMKTVRQ